MENAVIYARYSSHNQTENSIEAQVEEGMKYARSKGYNVIRTYIDRAKTGTNDNREDFQAMLKDTASSSFTVIIVWKVDRFGRNREEIALNKYRCKKNGVRVEYVAENITDGPEGVILESVLEGFAEYYSRALSQNTKRGLHNVAMKGGYTGGKCAYGYKIVDGKYTVDEEAAKKIKDVFKMFNSGLTYKEIGEKLNLSHRNVRFYITNSQYCTGEYNRCGVVIKDMVPKLISEEEFYKAQERANNYTRRKKPDIYLLTGKLICTCGKRYIGRGHVNKAYAYYKPTCNCTRKYLSKEKVERDVLTKAYAILKSDELIDDLTDKVVEKLKAKVKKENYSAKKESLLVRKQRLLRLVEDGALPYEDLRERLVQLDAEIIKFSGGASIPPIINHSDIKRRIIALRELDNESVLIEAFINSIIVDPNTNTWTINFVAE